MRKWIPALLIVAAVVASLAVYPSLPEQMPTHWSMSGEINGWSSRLFGAWLIPVMMAFVWVVMRALPHIDPRRENYEKFSGMYEILILLTLTFMLGLHVMVLMAATGKQIDVSRVTVTGVGLFFIVIGALLPRTRSNWFVGIRTPWTLTSEMSWEKTHKLGGLLFVVTGALVVATTLLAPRYAIWVLMCAAIGMTVFLFVYSYMVWKEDGQHRSVF